jgi:putative tryptophan/tyrosine transport system substrate-binding protein
MNRRDTVLGLLALGAAPLASEAQQAAKRARIGFISSSTTEVSSPFLVALREGLKARGYEEAKNLTLEYRFAKSREQLPAMAADLVSLKVDVILAGGTEGIIAAKDATQTIPIVMTNSGDPVKAGFAVSLARPGGNITGLTQISPELAGKRFQLLREVVPGITRVGVLWHPLHPTTPITFNETKAAAGSLGLQVMSLEIREPKEFEEVFRILAKERAAALVVLRDPFTVRHRTVIVESANKLRVATIYETGDYVEAGGLIFYGADFGDLFRRSAGFVDRILKGAKVSDLPIEQPTKFELVINLKTAKAIGITIPQSLLLRADRVIE